MLIFNVIINLDKGTRVNKLIWDKEANKVTSFVDNVPTDWFIESAPKAIQDFIYGH